MYNQIEYREGVIIGYSKGFNFDDNFVFRKRRVLWSRVRCEKKCRKIYWTGIVYVVKNNPYVS